MFHWSEKAQKSFTTVLALADFTKHFVVDADASSFGVETILMQDNKRLITSAIV